MRSPLFHRIIAYEIKRQFHIYQNKIFKGKIGQLSKQLEQ